MASRILSYVGIAWALFGLYIASQANIPWTSTDPNESLGITLSALFTVFVFIFPGLIIYGIFHKK